MLRMSFNASPTVKKIQSFYEFIDSSKSPELV